MNLGVFTSGSAEMNDLSIPLRCIMFAKFWRWDLD